MSLPLCVRLCTVLAVMLQCALATGDGSFSVNYYAQAGHPGVVGSNLLVHTAPSALHIADIYTQLCGIQPILHEDKVGLPTVDVFAARAKQPILLEVFGNVELPKSVKPVLKTNAHKPPNRGPEMKAVLEELKTHGIMAEGKAYEDAVDGQSVGDWIESHAADRPVIILHHAHMRAPSVGAPKATTAASTTKVSNKMAGKAAGIGTKRILAETSSATRELSEFEISQYQICLWTGLAFVLLVAVSVCTISQMEVLPDSLLYAKFQSGRTGRVD